MRVCHKHQNWLFESNIATSMQRNKHLFQLVPCESQLERGRSLDVDAGHLDFHHAIAESVAWLLQNHDMRPPGLSSLHRQYLHSLRRLGLTTSSGRVVQRELIGRFVDHFGADLLDQLHCGINSCASDNWLSTLVRKPRKSAHPIRHILLINFLGLKVDDFFKMERRPDLPFGRGPWPCLNPVVLHHKQPVIHKCVITRNTETGGPVGNFYCSCGFAYARTGPDMKKHDRFRRGRVISFGTEWERELIRLAVEERNGLRLTARTLGVDTNTVRKNLTRLTAESHKVPDHEHAGQQETRRANWFYLRSKHPEKGRNELRYLSPADFTWLYRNDIEWLRENLPPAKAKKTKVLSRVDWGKRDCSLASQVMFAAKQIKELPGKPARVTICSIGRMISERSLLEKKMAKLPMTKAVLDRVTENKEDFDVRRVRYAVAMLSEHGEPLHAWRIIRVACLRPGYSRKVSEEIERLTTHGFVEGVHLNHVQQLWPFGVGERSSQ